MTTNNGQPQQSFRAKIDFHDINPKSQWSNDDNEEVTLVDDESELNWDDGRRAVRHIEGGEEVDCEGSEEGDEILSNCESDDREHGMLSDSEDEQTINKINEHNISNYYTTNPNEVAGVAVGQEFENVQHFIRIKNDNKRFKAKCSNKGCPWFIYAAQVEYGTKSIIQKLNKVYECNGVLETKEASYKWIASQFERTLENNPKMHVKAMKDELVSNLGIKANMKKMYRPKKRAMDKLNGNYIDSYQRLRDYTQILRHRNLDVLRQACVDTYGIH
ncbi:hypothetical protein CUMW_178210 [Citrus unshiu]|uniref:Transposase MuDR plant domain-containing protein n=1 Tax=Citrus unshiu TaxID=55188 RepID=A0A2H5PY27_CITUN|nr:hypothetical protein CUMW_178210 [Citrus unshiu]